MFNQFFVNLFSRLIFYKLKGEIHTFAQKCIHFCALLLSPPTRVAWIETQWHQHYMAKFLESPPTRVAWIETMMVNWPDWMNCVATHTGGVDRNMCIKDGALHCYSVATHTGGVDRNQVNFKSFQHFVHVATHTGGVDRNWRFFSHSSVGLPVATHTGGVDRNFALL